MLPWPRQPRPHGGGGGGAGDAGGGAYPQPSYFPQNPNSQYPLNPQFYQQQQQQQFFLQNPSFQNPLVQTIFNALPQAQNPNFQNPYLQPPPAFNALPRVQNPNFQNPYSQPPSASVPCPQNVPSNHLQATPPASLPRPQNVPLKNHPQATMEKIEGAVAKAHRDLVTAGENVTAWKVSQTASVSLQVDSWSSLGYQLQDIPTLRRLLAIEGKINAFIHCFVGARRITSLYDLEVEICKNEGIERFEELGLGPLSRHPLVYHYFSIPSDAVEICKISSEDVITSLCTFMKKSDKKIISTEELLDYLAEQKSVLHKEKLGVRIHSLGLHVSFIRQAEKAEKTVLKESLGGTKCRKKVDSTGLAPLSAHTHSEKQMLSKRFDSICDRVKSFSSLCNVSGGNHIRFDSSSDDECDASDDDDVDGEDTNTGSHRRLSCDNSGSQNCPYPSAAEEMIRLGHKFDTGEKADSLKDKLMDMWGRSAGKKQKRKRKRNRQGKHDDTMNKFMKKEKTIDFSKNLYHTTVGCDLESFTATWKDACREHCAAKVLDLMINFYMTSSTEKKKERVRKVFSSLPGLRLLDVAVLSIRRGFVDSVYDTLQIFGDHAAASSAETIEINPSVKEDSVLNNTKDIDDCSCGVTVDDIIKNVAVFFSREGLMPIERDLSLGELVKTMQIFCKCEAWLSAQFSVKDFSSLGHGNFFSFMEKYVSLLPNELYSFLSRKSPEPSHVEASMLERQLGILLCQAESNLSRKDISKFDISLMLNKQFPTVSFHIVGNEPEKCSIDLINRLKDQNNSSCILYSMSLLGKDSTVDLLAFQEKRLSEGSGMETETGGQSYSQDNVTSKDAIKCLLKVPMLSDLLSWSHWDVLYAPLLGPLSNWLLNEVRIKELLCIATVDGKFIRIDPSATADDFLEAIIQGSPFKVALKLLSLLSLYGGVNSAPVSLLKCYVQRAIDVTIRNFTNLPEQGIDGDTLMHKSGLRGPVTRDKVKDIANCLVENQGTSESIPKSCVLSESIGGIHKAITNISRFILQCLEYLPLEFRSFGYDILVSGLRSVAKEAHSIILHECSHTNQRIMLHDIGLSLGIAEWIDDFHEFGSGATDLFISSTTLHKTSLCSESSGSSNHAGDTCEKPLLNSLSMSVGITANALDPGTNKLYDGANVGENDAILAYGCVKMKDSDGADIENCGIAGDSMVQDATSIIESIRREEFGLDPTLNHSDSCMLKKQHARLGRALHCLSQELYSQDSHLLLELVQNADDNIYPEGVDPTLVFVLQEVGIVVLNNEQGFSAENIRALCDIGNSTKKGSSAGYIGHKGIGFKSVFRVTDAPEIHSNGFHVKFDITEGQIGFVLPTVVPPFNVDIFRQQLSGERCSSNDSNTWWNTCIVLPFRSKSIDGTGMASIISMFSDLHPSLLLFLHRLRCIKFMNMLNNTLVNMRREIVGNGIVKVSHGEETMTWLVVSKRLPANLIRPDVQSTEIAVAFTLNECEGGEYKPHISQQPVFAFLPLRNYGLKFILQGDFVLPSSREEVDGNSDWNQWLLSEFPALFVSAEQSFCSLPCFQKHPGRAVSIYMSFVPLVGEVHGFFSHLPQMIISKLRMSNCLLLDGPDLTWVLPCRVLRGWNDQVHMLLSDGLLQKHLGLGYLSRDIELSHALAKALGIQDYGPEVLVEIISSVCRSKDIITSLGLDWLSAWLGSLYLALSTHSSGYYSLNTRFEHDIISSLRKIPFIPLSDGSYSSMADGPIWLPCDASSLGNEGTYSAAEFPSLYAKLRTVNPLLLCPVAPNMYTVEEAKRDNLVCMLCKLGVQQLSAHEVIKSHILVALSEDKHMDDHRNLMIEYLSFILLHFQHDCARCSSEKKDIISGVRKASVLLTNHGYKCPSNEPVHFGREYENPVDINRLIVGTVGDKWHEVDDAYLMHPSVRSLQCGVMKWRNFFQELGVTDFVQVACVRSESDIPYAFSGDTMPTDLSVASSFVNDWESSELLYFLSTFSSNKCREKCIYLLEILDKMWDTIYNEYSSGYMISKTSEGKRTIQSSFMKSLCEFEWIASSADNDLHQSKCLFYDCDEVRSILGNMASYAVPQVTSKLLLKDIGFRTEVSLDDAMRILHSQSMSKTPCMANVLQMSKFYSFISDGLHRSKVIVSEEFTSGSFIFVPFMGYSRHNDAVSGIFLSPKELYWDDPTGCVDKTKELIVCSSAKNNDSIPCKTLATIYPGLFDFFVNICGVPQSPPSSSYLQMLLQLSSIAPPSRAAHVVFRVFVKWADDLKSGSVNQREILDLQENLLKLEFAVLPTMQDKWVSLHPSFGLICWPDDDELKQQFKHSDGVDFLHFGELCREDQDKLSGTVASLMHDIGVPALSEAVSREAIFYGTHDNSEKASVINWILPYAQRYIYKLYPDIYFNLKRLGFEKLSQLKVIVVDKLFYKNCLQGRGSTSKRRFECGCLLQGGTLYVTVTADSHSIFLELSRIFFGSTELHFANFLHMVTTMAESGSTCEQTEFFILNSQKIPLLPVEEPIWCLTSVPELPEVENSEAVLASMNVDQNTLTASKRPGTNQNWPPTGWKTAPDTSYAKANYRLTRPWQPPSLCTEKGFVDTEKGSDELLDVVPPAEELPIPSEIDGEWIKGEGSAAATEILLQDSLITNIESTLEPLNSADGLIIPNSGANNELDDSVFGPAQEQLRLCYPPHDGTQSWKTGRLGEVMAYRYFVSKLGSINVRWVNEGAETGLPYDLVIGVDESSKEYIEVKATKYANKNWFELSTREWQFAVERGDSYTVAHVVLGAKKASITVLKNPARLCQQNALHLALLMPKQIKDSSVPT